MPAAGIRGVVYCSEATRPLFTELVAGGIGHWQSYTSGHEFGEPVVARALNSTSSVVVAQTWKRRE